MKLFRVFSWIYTAIGIVSIIIYGINTVALEDFLLVLKAFGIIFGGGLFLLTISFVITDIYEYFEEKKR